MYCIFVTPFFLWLAPSFCGEGPSAEPSEATTTVEAKEIPMVVDYYDRGKALVADGKYLAAIPVYEEGLAQVSGKVDELSKLYLLVGLGTAHLGVSKEHPERSVTHIVVAERIFEHCMTSTSANEDIAQAARQGLEAAKQLLVKSPYGVLTVPEDGPLLKRPEATPLLDSVVTACKGEENPDEGWESKCRRNVELERQSARNRVTRGLGVGFMAFGGSLTALGVGGFAYGSQVEGLMAQRGRDHWNGGGMLRPEQRGWVTAVAKESRSRWYAVGGVALGVAVSTAVVGAVLYWRGRRTGGRASKAQASLRPFVLPSI